MVCVNKILFVVDSWLTRRDPLLRVILLQANNSNVVLWSILVEENKNP